MAQFKAIETCYKGYRFRSRLEAKWAVFFDCCDVKWEYEPEGYDLGKGLYYLPDFLLHNVATRNPSSKPTCDIYCEVKGNMSKKDSDKIWLFSDRNMILVLGNIPDGENMFEIEQNEMDQRDAAIENRLCPPFSFDTIDGDAYPAFPCKTKNNLFGIVGPDWAYDRGDYSQDDVKTFSAFLSARKARFEYGEHGYPEQKKEAEILIPWED